MGRPSRFSPEFREQAVELVRATGKAVAEVARGLQINDTTSGNWLRADRAERGESDRAELVGCHRRERSFSITRSDPTAEAAPARVDRQFVATAPNQLWVADVTYVPTGQGWLHLACVTDVFSRMVIGWSMTSHRTTDPRR